MQEVTVIIPNFNGAAYIRDCLKSLENQSVSGFAVIVVDNGSTDGSDTIVEQEFPDVLLLRLGENYGFCRAVNEGIFTAETPYVLLLNNDTQVERMFVESLMEGILKSQKRFSCQAKMIQFHDRDKMDDAGNYYNVLGWAFARGKGKSAKGFIKEEKIFASCGGAAIYRKEIMEQIGFFDEEHFAYLEDTDIGYRARIQGYDNVFIPSAEVYHYGSGTSGSRYNLFKIRFSSRNNVYMIYKNMPVIQLIWNLPLLLIGFLIKLLFFAKKGYGKEYAAGIKNGIQLSLKGRKNNKKVHFKWTNIPHYLKIQLELYVNIIRRLA